MVGSAARIAPNPPALSPAPCPAPSGGPAPTPRSPHTSVPLWAPCARRLRPTARSAPLPGLTAAATFLLGARAPHATWQPGSLWERGPGRALLRAARWPLECPEDTASGGGRPARPAPSGRTPGTPTAVLARPGPRGTCVPGPLRCRPSARVSGDPLPPGPCADATSPRDLPDRAVCEAVSPGHPERLPPSLPPHPARPGTRHPLPVSAPFPLGAGGRAVFPELRRAWPWERRRVGLSPCRLVVPVKGSKRSRLPLPWGHTWSFPGFVVFKNNSRVIITHSRRQGQAPCSGGRTFPSAAPTSPCAFRDVPGTAPSLQHLRPTWAASCPVLPLRTRLCRSFVCAVGSHPSRKPAARRRQRFPAPC